MSGRSGRAIGRARVAACRCPGPAARGVALVVLLVVLAAAGLAAAASLQSVQRAALVADAQRAVAAAEEAARMALRQCERGLLAVPPALDTWPPPAEGEAPAWQDPQAWWGTDAWAHSVPESVWAAADHGGAAGGAPQCLAQWQPGTAASGGHRHLLIVARGRSPDHVEDAGGTPLHGAQAWRQASVLLAPPDPAASDPPPDCEAPCAWRVVDRLEGALSDAPQP